MRDCKVKIFYCPTCLRNAVHFRSFLLKVLSSRRSWEVLENKNKKCPDVIVCLSVSKTFMHYNTIANK